MALIFFSVAHFVYLKETVADVRGWLPSHVARAYFTGCTFIAAALAVLFSLCARSAAMLSAWWIGLFVLLVWAPTVVAADTKSASQWIEAVIRGADGGRMDGGGCLPRHTLTRQFDS